MNFESTPRKNTPETVPNVPINTFVKLPSEEQHELATQTFEEIQKALLAYGFTESDNLAEVYKSLPQETMIVRRENPEVLPDLFTKGSYEIGFVGDQEYANCVEWKPSDGVLNMQNAYHEGYGQKNSIVTVVGISKKSGLEVKRLDESVQDFYGLDRRGVRSTHGEVAPSNLLFVSLRIPITHLHESLLTEDELDRKYEYMELIKGGKRPDPIFVHRGYYRKTALQ